MTTSQGDMLKSASDPDFVPEPAEEHRLWIGNIDGHVTEFSLLKVVQKFGPLKKFDFLYHKTGPDLGKPRGYCFVSYVNQEDAVKAMKGLNGKLALNKRLSVHWAREQKQDLDHPPSCPAGSSGQPIQDLDPASIQTQIQAIEAKLRQMEEGKDDLTLGWRKAAPPGSSQLSIVNRKLSVPSAKKPYPKRSYKRR